MIKNTIHVLQVKAFLETLVSWFKKMKFWYPRLAIRYFLILWTVPGIPPCMESHSCLKWSNGILGAFRIIRGAFTIIRGAFNIIRSGSSIIRGGSSIIRGAFTIIRGSSSIIRGGSSIIRGGSSIIRGAFTIIRGAFSIIRSGSSIIRGSSSIIRSAFTIIRGAFNIIRGGSSIIRGAFIIILIRIIMWQWASMFGQRLIFIYQSTDGPNSEWSICFEYNTEYLYVIIFNEII